MLVGDYLHKTGCCRRRKKCKHAPAWQTTTLRCDAREDARTDRVFLLIKDAISESELNCSLRWTVWTRATQKSGNRSRTRLHQGKAPWKIASRSVLELGNHVFSFKGGSGNRSGAQV